MEYDGDDDTNRGLCTWDNPQRICKEIGRLGNKKTSTENPEYSMIKIGHNTEESPGDTRRLAIIQTAVRNYQLILVWKTLKGVNNNNNNNNDSMDISRDKKRNLTFETWTWLRKGNLKRESESFLITAQNSAIRNNYIKIIIDNTQQNSKC